MYIILIWQNTFKFNHCSGWEIVCLFASSEIKWNKAEREWKGHFWKWVFKSPSLLVMAGRAVAVGYEWKWPWNANSHYILENDDLLIYSPISLSCPLFSSCFHYHHGHHHPCFLLSLLLFSPLFIVYSLASDVWFTLLFVVIHFPSYSLFLFCSVLNFLISVTPKFTQTTLCTFYLIPTVLSFEWCDFFCFNHREMYANYILWQTGPWKECCTKNSPLYYQFQVQIASAIRTIHQGWHPSILKCLYNWSVLWSYLKF